MKPSPLELERHFFRRIHVDAQKAPVPEHENIFDCSIEYGKDLNNPRRFRLLLRLRLKGDSDERPAYLAEFEILGFFRVEDAWPEEKCEDLVAVNGPSLLFGAIREMLLNLTGRMEHGPVNLRTVSFSATPDPAAQKAAAKRLRKTARSPARKD
ncbi:MAG: protein-export chaperone SecB [Opitutales bacterium]|nr:protein-export chaperone SecB [Opitutales bacterium]